MGSYEGRNIHILNILHESKYFVLSEGEGASQQCLKFLSSFSFFFFFVLDTCDWNGSNSRGRKICTSSKRVDCLVEILQKCVLRAKAIHNSPSNNRLYNEIRN